MWRKKPSVFLLLATGLSGFAATSSGFEALDLLSYSVGPVVLRPHVGLEETFDSNLFYRATNTQSDFITYISPGIDIRLGQPDRNFLNFSYLLRSSYYAENDDLDTLNHSFNLTDQYQGARFSITGSDKIGLNDSILGAGLNFVTTLTKWTSYLDRYTFNYSVSEKTSVYFTGLHDAANYESDSTLLDYNTLMGTVGFAYKGLPKTDFFGEIYYGQTATDPNTNSTPKGPHSDFVGAFIGANGSFTAKLTGTAKVGYEWRTFSNDQPSPNAPVADISLTQRFTDKTSVSLGYSHRTAISVQNGSASYVSDLLTARLQQAFGTRGKWNGSLLFGYQTDSFDQNVFANRKDILYIFSAGLSYQIQLWLRAALTYDYQNFSSNDTQLSDYDVHRLNVSITLGY